MLRLHLPVVCYGCKIGPSIPVHQLLEVPLKLEYLIISEIESQPPNSTAKYLHLRHASLYQCYMLQSQGLIALVAMEVIAKDGCQCRNEKRCLQRWMSPVWGVAVL